MGKTYERIDGRLRTFIEEQPMFFTATAPLADDGTINLSPKGLKGSFAIIDELTVAYLDFAGSNAETIAHLRENGRITLMWCAFQGPPNIVRVHGRGEPVFRDDPRFPGLLGHFPDSGPDQHGLRAVIVVTADLIRDTCGYAVPFMSYDEDRDLHAKRFAREDDASLNAYFEKKEHIARSIDGLPGLPLPLPPTPPGVTVPDPAATEPAAPEPTGSV
ncbi:pyridoxamine 5'-phosphate oxidase family protein [Streptomyces alfalfae]|uniref:pyridoxamine 5'-phosphate oxidase family protein n=1 Tax=Streptomyces alfalfae TaxID=1642299 RepID=UPI001BA443F9|nr:pyridoxamine 5'-phosphate oxidase family protein [Streptomyces alfalfae]QUI30815.1 pyridoxamine 5'-phosphate oxidase family protein [Streptomyces alfalfae]